jgi:hypothetical protein
VSSIARTLRNGWPVAISASVHPAMARGVTAVARRSWNVTPTTPARIGTGGCGHLATQAWSGAAPAAAGRCEYRERNDARDCQITRPPTEAASGASYQTYRDARAIRITTTTANKVICAHRLLAKLWLLLSLCIAMVMTSFQDTILNGGIQKRAPVNGKGH